MSFKIESKPSSRFFCAGGFLPKFQISRNRSAVNSEVTSSNPPQFPATTATPDLLMLTALGISNDRIRTLSYDTWISKSLGIFSMSSSATVSNNHYFSNKILRIHSYTVIFNCAQITFRTDGILEDYLSFYKIRMDGSASKRLSRVVLMLSQYYL